MKRKRLAAVILTAVVAAAFGLAACGSKADSGQTQNSRTKAATTAADTASKGTDEKTGADTASKGTDEKTEPGALQTGKTLIVYYSATGSTKAVAQTIAEATGGDLFELQPVQAYTSEDLDWTRNSSRVSKEHDNESLRTVELAADTMPDWDSYSTVLIGYPIWWGIAAWPVDGFVKANDFTGKTVIPFCTSSSSGLGDSGELLKKMAGTGNWKDGKRFASGVSALEVQSWIKGLGL